MVHFKVNHLGDVLPGWDAEFWLVALQVLTPVFTLPMASPSSASTVGISAFDLGASPADLRKALSATRVSDTVASDLVGSDTHALSTVQGVALGTASTAFDPGPADNIEIRAASTSVAPEWSNASAWTGAAGLGPQDQILLVGPLPASAALDASLALHDGLATGPWQQDWGVAAPVPAGGFERFTAAAPLDIALLVGPCRLAETDSHWPLPATLHVLPPIIAAPLAIALP